MTVTIQELTTSDLRAVDDLGKPSRKTLGFLPEQALLELLRKGWVYGAVSESGELTGYLIYARYPERFRITQLCVSEVHRGAGIARLLLRSSEDLRHHAEGDQAALST